MEQKLRAKVVKIGNCQVMCYNFSMSRAFVFEKDGMFHCNIKDRDCPDANLRGGCDLIRCRHDDEMANANDVRHDELNNEKLGPR